MHQFCIIFSAKPDPESLSSVVKGHAFALEGMTVPAEEVNAALETLVAAYLRIGELVKLLKDVPTGLTHATLVEELEETGSMQRKFRVTLPLWLC